MWNYSWSKLVSKLRYSGNYCSSLNPNILNTWYKTQDNAKLLKQLRSGFKRTINWNKYQLNVSTERVNQYLNFLIDPSFQGINILFVLPFENEAQRTSYKRYYLPTRKIKIITFWSMGKGNWSVNKKYFNNIW